MLSPSKSFARHQYPQLATNAHERAVCRHSLPAALLSASNTSSTRHRVAPYPVMYRTTSSPTRTSDGARGGSSARRCFASGGTMCSSDSAVCSASSSSSSSFLFLLVFVVTVRVTPTESACGESLPFDAGRDARGRTKAQLARCCGARRPRTEEFPCLGVELLDGYFSSRARFLVFLVLFIFLGFLLLILALVRRFADLTPFETRGGLILPARGLADARRRAQPEPARRLCDRWPRADDGACPGVELLDGLESARLCAWSLLVLVQSRGRIQTSARHGVPSGRRRRLGAFSQRLRGRRTPQGRRARNGASACRRQMKTRTSVVAVMIRTLRQRRRHEPFQFAVRLGGIIAAGWSGA